MAYVRTVRTSSGATSVQIVWSSRRGSRSIEHIGSAHDEAALAALKAAAAQRLAAGQAELDLGVTGRPGWEPLLITSTRAAHLWDALCRAYDVLGFDPPAGTKCSANWCARGSSNRPAASRLFALLDETGVAGPSLPTLNRRLPVFAKAGFRQALSKAYADHGTLGPMSLVLYDVSTLSFETDAQFTTAETSRCVRSGERQGSDSCRCPIKYASSMIYLPQSICDRLTML